MAKPIHDRAAQFAPYAALVGFEQVIRARTVTVAPRRELLADELERIDSVLATLAFGDTVRVVYYRDGAYITAVGILTDIDSVTHTLTVVKNRISLSDLYDVERIEQR